MYRCRRCPFSPRRGTSCPQGTGDARCRPTPGARAVDGSGRYRRDGSRVARAGRRAGDPARDCRQPNAGAFDPIDEMAELAWRYSAWLRMARSVCSPPFPHDSAPRPELDRAHSVAVDGHNGSTCPTTAARPRPRPQTSIARPSSMAAYLGQPTGSPSSAIWGPRCRARAVTGGLGDAARVRPQRIPGDGRAPRSAGGAAQVDADSDLQRLADVPLNVVASDPPASRKASSTTSPRRLGQAVLDDGRIFFGTTVYDGKVAFRPAIVNWRTEEAESISSSPSHANSERVSARSSARALSGAGRALHGRRALEGSTLSTIHAAPAFARPCARRRRT